MGAYKIGRKLPESTPEYKMDDSVFFHIKTPEMFRVVVKWVGDLEALFMKPEEEVRKKKFFKNVSKVKENEKAETQF